MILSFLFLYERYVWKRGSVGKDEEKEEKQVKGKKVEEERE